jgi:hypothetical protein
MPAFGPHSITIVAMSAVPGEWFGVFIKNTYSFKRRIRPGKDWPWKYLNRFNTYLIQVYYTMGKKSLPNFVKWISKLKLI